MVEVCRKTQNGCLKPVYGPGEVFLEIECMPNNTSNAVIRISKTKL